LNRFCDESSRALATAVARTQNETVSKEAQTSGTVLMVRPASFGFHAEAAESNVFAHSGADVGAALGEIDAVVGALENAGVEVVILEDTPDPA
jgi:hypothetical protein